MSKIFTVTMNEISKGTWVGVHHTCVGDLIPAIGIRKATVYWDEGSVLPVILKDPLYESWSRHCGVKIFNGMVQRSEKTLTQLPKGDTKGLGYAICVFRASRGIEIFGYDFVNYPGDIVVNGVFRDGTYQSVLLVPHSIEFSVTFTDRNCQRHTGTYRYDKTNVELRKLWSRGCV